VCVASQPAVDCLFQTCNTSSIHPFFCLTVASNFYSSWDECPSNLWTFPFPNLPLCLVFRPTGVFTFSFIGTAARWSLNRFHTRRGGFCMPGTGGAFTHSTNAVPVPSAGTAKEVGPLTSSSPSRGQSSGGALWRAVYTPGDFQTSPAYSSQSAQ
jgi:hypothetical protein